MLKQKIISTLLLSLSLAHIIPVHAEDGTTFVGIHKNRTAKILDNFKDQEKVLLFDNVPFSSEDELGLFNAERKMNNLSDILKRVEKAKSQYKEQKQIVTRQKLTLKRTIAELDESITEMERSISDTEEAIAEKNRKIAEYNDHITDLQKQIASNKEAILKYLVYVYNKGDLIYDDAHNVDVLRSIILNDGDLSEIMNDIHYKSLLQIAGQNFIEQHRSLIKEYYYNKEALKKEKMDFVRLKRELVAKNNDLVAQKDYKVELLEITRGQEALFNQYIAEKQKSEESLRDRLGGVEEQYVAIFAKLGAKYRCESVMTGSLLETSTGDTMDEALSQTGSTKTSSGITKSAPSMKSWIEDLIKSCSDLQRFYAAERQLIDFPFDDKVVNKFTWPVSGTRISTYFHDEGYYVALGSEHEAIDVPMPQSSDIVAPAAGYVYFIVAPAPGKYGYVALKHADGFVTVYGHISELLVGQFDFVEPGMLFARTGWARGTPGAWVMTSGAHLHFEMYQNRESVDPLRFMDTTRFKYDDLPQKYRYKFVEDLKARYGNRTNTGKYATFVISGDSEIERQKYLLANYATPAFADQDMWTEEAVGAGIDPSFLMCVGLAETGLGNHLKTANNVGNIGNTDSGGTYDFDNPREGVYWMGKTLNNKILGKHNTIDQLSRWGNKTGSIYASSASHWHNNVVRCLSALKGRFVEDNYKFRLADDAKEE